jgi:hypothetical protein
VDIPSVISVWWPLADTTSAVSSIIIKKDTYSMPIVAKEARLTVYYQFTMLLVILPLRRITMPPTAKVHQRMIGE